MFGGRISGFLWNHSDTIFRIYFPTMFANGFYRGTQSISYYDYKDGKIKDQNELYLDKFLTCIYIGVAHATWFGPVAIYQSIGRTEIALTNKNPYDHEDLYRDMFMYITLKPKEIKNK